MSSCIGCHKMFLIRSRVAVFSDLAYGYWSFFFSQVPECLIIQCGIGTSIYQSKPAAEAGMSLRIQLPDIVLKMVLLDKTTPKLH